MTEHTPTGDAYQQPARQHTPQPTTKITQERTMEAAVWAVIDTRTGRRATSAAYFTREQAESAIASWMRRHERGGRPDIPREMLDALEARLISFGANES